MIKFADLSIGDKVQVTSGAVFSVVSCNSKTFKLSNGNTYAKSTGRQVDTRRCVYTVMTFHCGSGYEIAGVCGSLKEVEKLVSEIKDSGLDSDMEYSISGTRFGNHKPKDIEEFDFSRKAWSSERARQYLDFHSDYEKELSIEISKEYIR